MSATLSAAFLKAGFKPVKPRNARPAKPIKCRKCGANMVKVPDSNVAVCTNDIEIKRKDSDEVLTRPCGNQVIFSH